MPSITSGSNATVTLTSPSIVDINCPGGWVQVEYPAGTKVFEGNPAGQSFGPYDAGSMKITSVQGAVYYEVDPVPSKYTSFDSASVAVGWHANVTVGTGDSITARSVDSTNNVFADSWYTYLCALSNGRLPYGFNAGHGGYTSTQLLALLQSEVISRLPSNGQAIIAWGRNDSQTLATTIANDKAAASALLAAGIRPAFCTLPPVGVVALGTPAAPSGTPSASGGTLASATYTYTVVANNGIGSTLPSTGTGVTVTGPTGSVVLTWSYQPGATGYSIYRNNQLIGSTSNGWSLTFTDTGQAGGAAAPGSNTTGVTPSAADTLFTAKVNAWRKRYCSRNGFTLIDFYTVLADPTTGYYKQGYSTDGTHPSPIGDKAMGTQAWTQMTERTESNFGYVASDAVDPLNLYTNGLFTSGGTVPTGWAGVSAGTTSTLGAVAGFKGNAFQITRSSASAAGYFGQFDVTTGFSVGDVVQFSCVASFTGADATGAACDFGCRLPGATAPTQAADWQLRSDVTNPTLFVGPEVTVPSGTTALRLLAFLYGGTGVLTVGQYTIRNLTTGGTLTV